MQTRRKRNHRQRGIALILALIVLVVLSTVAAAMILVSQTEIYSTANYRLLAQARYAAEAGAQQAAFWLDNPASSSTMYQAPTNYSLFNMTTTPVTDSTSHQTVILTANGTTANYPATPNANLPTNFSNYLNGASVPGLTNATYKVTATLISMSQSTPPSQVWEIKSIGTVAGIRTAQIQVVKRIERVVNNSPAYAFFATSSACNAITISGNLTTDSWNSSVGTYSATHTNSGGNLGSNGSLLGSGSPAFTVYGKFSSPLPASEGSCPSHSYNYSGSATFSAGVAQLSSAWTPPPVPAPTGTPTSASVVLGSGCSGFSSGCTGSGSNITLAPGTYNALINSGTETVNLTAGTYNFYSLTSSGTFTFNVTSGPVVINFTSPSSPVTASGAWLSNPTGIPSNLTINYAGTGSIPLSGSSSTYAVVNAPNAPVVVSGSGDWYGSIVSSTFTSSGGAKFHYDQALGSGGSVTDTKFHNSYFSWSKQ